MSLERNILAASLVLAGCTPDQGKNNTDTDAVLVDSDTPTTIPYDSEDTDLTGVTTDTDSSEHSDTEDTDLEISDTAVLYQLNPTQELFQKTLLACIGTEAGQGIDPAAAPIVIANAQPDAEGVTFTEKEKAEVINGVEKIFGPTFEDIQILKGTGVTALYTESGNDKAVYFFEGTDLDGLQDRDWTNLHPADTARPFFQCFFVNNASTEFSHVVWEDGEGAKAILVLSHIPAFDGYDLPEEYCFNGDLGSSVCYPVEPTGVYDFTPTATRLAQQMNSYGVMKANLDQAAADPRGYGVDTGPLNGSNGIWVAFPQQE